MPTIDGVDCACAVPRAQQENLLPAPCPTQVGYGSDLAARVCPQLRMVPPMAGLVICQAKLVEFGPRLARLARPTLPAESGGRQHVGRLKVSAELSNRCAGRQTAQIPAECPSDGKADARCRGSDGKGTLSGLSGHISYNSGQYRLLPPWPRD